MHCAQWSETTIPAKDMESMDGAGIYDERDVRNVLLSIEGGVTSDVVRQAVSQLSTVLKLSLTNFALSGFKDEPELQRRRQSNDNDGPMLRIGAPRSVLCIGYHALLYLDSDDC